MLKTKFLRNVLRPSVSHVYAHHNKAEKTQTRLLKKLLKNGAQTKYGKEFNVSQDWLYEDFKKHVPHNDYHDLEPYIERMRKDEMDVLWPGHIDLFSKSSGTTSSRSKYIPVSREALKRNHFLAGKDTAAFYLNAYPTSTAADGSNVAICGSLEKEGNHYVGDISALIAKNMPFWIKGNRKPGEEIALMNSWEEKIDPMSRDIAKDDVRVFSGVASWMSHVCKRVIEFSEKENLHQVWPHFQYVLHGGVSVTPYREMFLEMFSEEMRDKVVFQEAYNASEGFFAVQDTFPSLGMLLFLNHGIFYEFVPEISKGQFDYGKAVTISDVKMGQNYAMLITTNSGLWRYDIGDTVAFTSINPYRIKITGRTKSFLNLCGEEVMVHNTDEALKKVCEKFKISGIEYTATIYQDKKTNTAFHEWVIGLDQADIKEVRENKKAFEKSLDSELRKINSDYDAKRTGDIALQSLRITFADKKVFEKWLSSKGKTSMQSKIPRLLQDRGILEEIKAFI